MYCFRGFVCRSLSFGLHYRETNPKAFCGTNDGTHWRMMHSADQDARSFLRGMHTMKEKCLHMGFFDVEVTDK